MFRSVPMFITVSGNFLCVVQKCVVFQCRIKAISMKSHWTVYMFVTLFMLLQSFTNIWISLHSVFGKRCNFPPINMHLLFTVIMNFTSTTRNTCTLTEVLMISCLTYHFQSSLPLMLSNSCKQNLPVEDKVGQVKSRADKTIFCKRTLWDHF